MPFQISSILIQASIDHTEFAKVASSTLTSQVFYSPFSLQIVKVMMDSRLKI